MKIRLLHDWIVVRCEPLRERTLSGIILPLGGRVRTGEVIQVGPGKYAYDSSKRIPLGVELGERVAFFRENMEHQQGKMLASFLLDMDPKHEYALIRVGDVLMRLQKGVEIEEGPR